MEILNPNCSETIWKLTGIKSKGRTEFEFDTANFKSSLLIEQMVLLMKDAPINKVGIKILEDSGSFNNFNGEDAMKIALKLAKMVKRGKITSEEAATKFDSIIGV